MLESGVGVLTGVVVGRVLAAVAFRAPRASLRIAERGDPLLALAALLTELGLSELVGGYGCLAVFVCAMTVRASDRTHAHHEVLHGVLERLERLLTLLVLLVLGIVTTHGLFDHLDGRGIMLGLALVFLIRPLSGWLALSVARRRRGAGSVGPREAVMTAFFGVRGPGSVTTSRMPRVRRAPGGALAVVPSRLHHRPVRVRPWRPGDPGTGLARAPPGRRPPRSPRPDPGRPAPPEPPPVAGPGRGRRSTPERKRGKLTHRYKSGHSGYHRCVRPSYR